MSADEDRVSTDREPEWLHVRFVAGDGDLVAAHDEHGATLYVADDVTADEVGAAVLESLDRANRGKMDDPR